MVAKNSLVSNSHDLRTTSDKKNTSNISLPVDNANERLHVYTWSCMELHVYTCMHSFPACMVSLCACMHTVYDYVTRFNIKKSFHLQKGPDTLILIAILK